MNSKQSTITLRLPNELKQKIKLMAEVKGVSVNQFVLSVFEKAILANYDAIMKKVGKRKVPNWDKL